MNKALLFWGGVTMATGGLLIGQVIPQMYPQYDLSVDTQSSLQPAALVIVDYSTWIIIAGIVLFLLAFFL